MRWLHLSCVLAFAGSLSARGQGTSAPSEAATAETEHEVAHANTLWDLAAHYYHDPWQWPRIYEANKSKIKNPHWIYPGQIFVIPGRGKTVTVLPKVEPKAEPPAEPQPEPETKPEPEPEPAASQPLAYDPGEGEGVPTPDSLSVRMPKGMAGQQPSLYRMRMPKGWSEDGRVLELDGRETAAAEGDFIHVRIDHPETVSRGQRYEVYRRAAPVETDADQSAQYMQKAGLIEVTRKLSKNRFQALILKSGDILQVGDLLKRAL